MQANQSHSLRETKPYALLSTRWLALALIAALIGFITPAQAEEPRMAGEKPAVKAAPDLRVERLDDASMKKLRQLAEPTEQQRLLSALEGAWNYTVTFRTDDGAAPQTSTGAMTNEMAVGGRFLSSKTALILNVGEQSIPYEGWGLLGYDPERKVFTSVWADTMHADVIKGTGTYNEKLKTIEEKGRFTLPLSGKEQAYRAELHWDGGDTYTRTIFVTGKSGREFKLVEIEFQKRK